MKEKMAGIIIAGRTEWIITSRKHFAVLDGAFHTRVRFIEVLSPATRAGFLVPNIGTAQAAINSARGNNQRVHDLNLNYFGWHKVYTCLFH
jgi:hypothetical protein